MNLSSPLSLTLDIQVAVNEEVTVEGTGYITMDGLSSIATVLGSPFSFNRSWMQFIGLGAGELAAGTEDRYLQNEIYRKIGDPSYSLNTYSIYASFGANEPESVETIREVGIFNKIAGGIMAARWLLDADIEKALDDIINVTCTITIDEE